jgi:hypothetical protein
MTAEMPENDFRNTPQDMTPEGNSDVSHAHLLRWALDHGRIHFVDGVMEIDSDDSPDAKTTEDDLRELQAKISRDEAGTPLRFPNDPPTLPEAS